jgi:hypothetical protein
VSDRTALDEMLALTRKAAKYARSEIHANIVHRKFREEK